MKDISIKKNFIYNTFYQILCLIVPLITIPYISRVLGPTGVGTYSYIHSIITYFVMLASLGTYSYASREISRNRDDRKKISKIFWEIEIMTVFTSLLAILLWLIISLLYADYTMYMLAMSLLLVNAMLDISWLYAGLEQFKYTVIINSIFKVFGIFLIFTFVKNQDDLINYIFISSVVSLLGTVSMWFYLKKFINKFSFKNLQYKEHFRNTLIYFIPTIAISIYTVLDKTLIGLITKDLSENGYYEQATKIIEICKAITFISVNMALGTRISYLYVQKKYEEIKQRIETSIDYILFMGIGIVFGLIAVSDVFVPVFFGNDFANTSLYIKLLSPIILIVGISNCLGSHYYTPAGLRKQSAKYIVIGAIINLIINLIMIPRFHGVGAIFGTLIAESIITFLYLKNCNGYLNISIILLKSYKKIFAGIVMLLIVNLLIDAITNVMLVIMISIFVGSLVYILLLILTKDSFVYDKCLNIIKEKMVRVKNARV